MACRMSLVLLSAAAAATLSSGASAPADCAAAVPHCADPPEDELHSHWMMALTGDLQPTGTEELLPRRVTNIELPAETASCAMGADSSSPLQQRARCPWYRWVQNDANQYPQNLTQVSNCTSTCRPGDVHSCQPVNVNQTVLRKTRECKNGVAVYAAANVTVTIAYVCALNPAASGYLPTSGPSCNKLIGS